MSLRRLPYAVCLVLTFPMPHSVADTLQGPRAADPSSWRTTVVRATVGPDDARPARSNVPSVTSERGLASYYWQGGTTASGEPFDKSGLTAAHPTLPFDTRVKVTELTSGRSVVVRINDRGPFVPGRVIDISERAAELLGFTSRGLAQVQLEVLTGN